MKSSTDAPRSSDGRSSGEPDQSIVLIEDNPDHARAIELLSEHAGQGAASLLCMPDAAIHREKAAMRVLARRRPECHRPRGVVT